MLPSKARSRKSVAVDGATGMQVPQEYNGELEDGVETSVGLTCGVASGGFLTAVKLATATPNDGGVDGNRNVDELEMLLAGQRIGSLTMRYLMSAQSAADRAIAAVCRTDFAAEKRNIAAVDVKLPLQRQ
ncbi:hypothetical protein C8R45DRAFT_934650 [Mycena sanguinolenta]|nr:hypothetical protein C8R45DRAFT_934650 [Mycena sanguinolenta]